MATKAAVKKGGWMVYAKEFGGAEARIHHSLTEEDARAYAEEYRVGCGRVVECRVVQEDFKAEEVTA